MKGFIRPAIYARVSGHKQVIELTIESQRHELLERVRQDKLSFDESFEFCDDGYTGTELLRPALDDLRDKIAYSMIDRLYVHSPDRLARKLSHQALLLEEFSKFDCEIIFLNNKGMPDGPEGNLLVQLQGIIAEYEREKMMERTRRGRRYAATRGSVSVFSGAPYGYQYVNKHDGGGEARWEIDPLESDVVRLMFKLVDEKEMSLNAVCRELQSRGFRTRTGKEKWDSSTVRGILLNHSYYGKAKYGKQRLAPRKQGKRPKRGDPVVPRRSTVAVATSPEEQVTISVPIIVDKSQFERVSQQMKENRKRQRQRQDGPKYLLSGLVLCGECGSAYCSRRSSDGRYFYYRCIGADKYRRTGREVCTNASVQGKELEARVWSELCELLRDPERLTVELKRRRQETPSSSSHLKKTQRTVNGLRDRIDRLIDAFTSGLLKKSEFECRIGPLRDKHDREAMALASLSGTESCSNDATTAIEQLKTLSDQVTVNLETASETLKRELLELLIARVEVYRETIRIVYKVPCLPFAPSLDNRGFLQHQLQCHVSALGFNRRRR